VNTIPGRVKFSVDIRAPDDAQRTRLLRGIRADLARIAAARNVRIDAAVTHELLATPCAPRLQDRVAEAIAATGMPVHRLASGAGHDGMALRDHCDIGMVFVRCAGGISHNPAESATDADIALGARVLMRLIEDLG
jgi:acetylornithine deacetylase/succinyl-diaminopimelate desuccinylase-like protein